MAIGQRAFGINLSNVHYPGWNQSAMGKGSPMDVDEPMIYAKPLKSGRDASKQARIGSAMVTDSAVASTMI